MTETLSIALDHYDRHFAFFMGTVPAPEGTSFKPINAVMSGWGRDGGNRHHRMFAEREFDIAEVSLASYIVGKARNPDFGFTATPVFPRRLFSQNQMFVNVDTGIETPRDLIGRKVGLRSFQTTLSVLAKGDLKFAYDVPWEDIHWFVKEPDEIETPQKPGVRIERLDRSADLGAMLVAGEIDALFMPHPPPIVHNSPKVRRLFRNPRSECISYFKRFGVYPLMHLFAFTDAVVARRPELPREMIGIWDEAKRQADHFNDDPAFCQAAFAHLDMEEQRNGMARDLWPSGLKANRAGVEMFVKFLHDQGMIEKPVPVEALFHPSVLDT